MEEEERLRVHSYEDMIPEFRNEATFHDRLPHSAGTHIRAPGTGLEMLSLKEQFEAGKGEDDLAVVIRIV